MPNIHLDESKQWQIRVIHFCATLKTPLPKSIVLQLSSNIISRATGNSKQVLIALAIPSGSIVINISPNQPPWYKIRFHDLETVHFKIHQISGGALENISEAFIQLEITQYFDGL